MAKVLVHADAPSGRAGRGGSASPFGQSAGRHDDGTLILRVRPAQWLLLRRRRARPRPGRAMAGAAGGDGEFVSVVDVTAGRSLLRLTGDAGPTCWPRSAPSTSTPPPTARPCAARWPRSTPRSSGPTTTGGRRSYLLACDRSFGQYLFGALADAGAEFSSASARRSTTAKDGLMTGTFPSDLAIARQARLKPLDDIARRDGHRRAPPRAVRRQRGQDQARGHRASWPTGPRPSTSWSPRSRPTPLGEGKTTTTVGLGQAFAPHRQAGHDRHPPAVDGPDVRHQGRRRRRRLQPGRADGACSTCT